MHIDTYVTLYAVSEYDYTPPEYFEHEGTRYVKSGTGESSAVRVLSFKKRGLRVPRRVEALLTPEHVEALRMAVADGHRAHRIGFFAEALEDLRPALHRATRALAVLSEEDTGGAWRIALSDIEIARLYALVETFKRELTSAGFETPGKDAKDDARAWLEEHQPACPEDAHTEAENQDLTVHDAGLALYRRKHQPRGGSASEDADTGEAGGDRAETNAPPDVTPATPEAGREKAADEGDLRAAAPADGSS